jgi:hypothetical protein
MLYRRFSRSLSAGTRKIPFGSHKSSGPSDLQSTSVLNEAGPHIDTHTQAKTVKTIVLKIIIPTTEEKMSTKKYQKETSRQDMLLGTLIVNEQELKGN